MTNVLLHDLYRSPFVLQWRVESSSRSAMRGKCRACHVETAPKDWSQSSERRRRYADPRLDDRPSRNVVSICKRARSEASDKSDPDTRRDTADNSNAYEHKDWEFGSLGQLGQLEDKHREYSKDPVGQSVQYAVNVGDWLDRDPWDTFAARPEEGEVLGVAALEDDNKNPSGCERRIEPCADIYRPALPILDDDAEEEDSQRQLEKYHRDRVEDLVQKNELAILSANALTPPNQILLTFDTLRTPRPGSSSIRAIVMAMAFSKVWEAYTSLVGVTV